MLLNQNTQCIVCHETEERKRDIYFQVHSGVDLSGFT